MRCGFLIRGAAPELLTQRRRNIKNKAEVTVACNPVQEEETRELGIMGVDKDFRINKFVEKPQDKKEVKDFSVDCGCGGKRRFLASMGIYIFNKDTSPHEPFRFSSGHAGR